MALCSLNTPQNLVKEEVIQYFNSFGIRIECSISHSQSQYHGWASEMKIYCPSKYTKESLTDSAHIISGYYIEFSNPYKTEFVKDRPYILEPMTTELQAFDLRMSYLLQEI